MTARARRAGGRSRIVVVVLAAVLVPPRSVAGEGLPALGEAYLHTADEPIPAFARMYRTACSTCHVAAPKLNVLGEAFRMNAYRMPQSELLVRADEPVSLGADPWKEVWPRAIWPADLPGHMPFALRIQSDLFATRRGSSETAVNFDFPHEVYLLAGAPIGEGVGVFFEAEWKPGGPLDILQAKVAFQNVLSSLPDGALNLWMGLLNPTVLSFTDRQTDRAGRQKFSWQEFKLSDLTFDTPSGTRSSVNGVVMGEGIAAAEVNGLLHPRVHWGLGVAQGMTELAQDANGRKDVYYRVKAKLGGLDYRGRYAQGGGPPAGAGGQLLDRSVTIEHFGYFGREDRPGEEAGAHRALGLAARALQGRSDLGVGVVRRTFDTPFGGRGGGSVRATSLFAKWEYLLYPWLTWSLKADRLEVSTTAGALPAGTTLRDADATRILPGFVMLVRQNVRAVVEGELFTRHAAADRTGARRPHTLWMRLDLSF